MESNYCIQNIEKLSKNCIDKYNNQLDTIGIHEFGADKIHKCKNIVLAELHIFFIYWTDVMLYIFNSALRESIMTEIYDYFFQNNNSNDLLNLRLSLYCENTQKNKCDIPHFWLPRDFDDTQLDYVGRSACLLIDIILQDTILEKHVSDTELHTIHRESLGIFSLSMSELFHCIISNLYILLKDKKFKAQESFEKEDTKDITMHVLSSLHGYSKETVQRTDNNSDLIDKWLDSSTGCLYMFVMYNNGEPEDFFVTKELFEITKNNLM